MVWAGRDLCLNKGIKKTGEMEVTDVIQTRLDPEVLERLMAAGSSLHALSTEDEIAETAIEILGKVPGVRDCWTCIRGVRKTLPSSQAPLCRECPVNFDAPDTMGVSCRLFHEHPEFIIIPIETATRLTGFLGVACHGKEWFQPYRPFVNHLVHHLALVFENRRQNEKLKAYKKIENRFRQTSELFQKVFHSQLEAIFVLNADALPRIVSCNRAATTMFGYGFDEMKDQSIDMLLTDDVSAGRFHKAAQAAVVRDGKLSNFRYDIKRKDGITLPAELTLLALKTGGSERSGWLFIVRDLSHRQQMEMRLRQAQKMESIGTLAGGIAHDFNNILFPIIGMSELLLEDIPEENPGYDNIREIHKAGRRGSELVGQILAFSRQTGHQMMPMQIRHVLKEVLKLVRSTIPANIEIRQKIDNDCRMVNADPTQIHQVIMNLITNAYHAVETSGGTITVELTETQIAPTAPATGHVPERYALLSVADTGPGVSPDIMGKIFEPYFTTKEKGKGTGLGLAVVHGIVSEHHGKIDVINEPGKGVTFKVFLPIMVYPRQSGTDETLEMHATGNERILLVDDEVAITRLVGQILERIGYHVTECNNSLKALSLFTASPNTFDLVISDMAMPGMTGIQLTDALAAVRPDIPVIICTGFTDNLDSIKRRPSVKGCLMKPVVKSDIAIMVRNVLDGELPPPVQMDHQFGTFS